MKIYIDPGHGGSDPGAIGNGLFEKDLTLDISLRQKDLFERLGHEVKMSRTEDKTVSLEARIQDANRWRADVFISNHINAGGGQGVEVWHSIVGGKSKEYAKRVEEKLRMIFKSRGLKTREGRNGDYLFVIRATNMPAILNEFGFIDNIEDTTKLKREDIRQRCAEAVVYGLLKIEIQNQSPVKIDKPKEEKVNQSIRLLRYIIPMMSGDDVKKVQNKLNELGFSVGIADGIYGRNTENGVKNFQKVSGLLVDGIVGQNTVAKLFSSKSLLKLKRVILYTIPMMTGEDVKLLQQRLNTLGFNPGSEDGVYGAKTVEAVKRYQRIKGLKIDGIVGEITWNSLIM